jgi:hypothetical protein
VKFSVACMRGVGTAITGVFYWQSGFARDPEEESGNPGRRMRRGREKGSPVQPGNPRGLIS